LSWRSAVSLSKVCVVSHVRVSVLGLDCAVEGHGYHICNLAVSTRITKVELYLTSDVSSSAVFVQVETDAGITEMRRIAALGEIYYQNLILHNNAGPLGTAASLHAALAIPKVALPEAPWVYASAETDVVGPYPEVVDGYALPLEGPGLGRTFDEALAASKPFRPSLQPRLDAPDGPVRGF